jgi:uncharacterized membrane protein YdbT with pleckstrin-like domain
MSIKPDRRWLTKQILVLLTITALLAVAAGITQLSIVLAVDTVDTGLVAAIVWSIAGGLAVLLWIIALPAVILWFRNLEYLIEPDKIVIRKGILTKIQQNIPLGMVTDFRLQRTLYDRALGIGSIQVQTAGQGATATGYEGKLAGLEEWDRLHEDLRHRIRPNGRPGRAAEQEPGVDAILDELRHIRRVLETRD